MAGYPQPQKYTAKNGKVFQYDAREKLAIEDVEAKCNAIVEAAKTGCEAICKEISGVQIGKETLCVADSSLEPALEEVSNYIKSIATEGIEPTTDEILSQAAAKFSELQTEEDERAKADCEAENAAYDAAQAKKEEDS